MYCRTEWLDFLMQVSGIGVQLLADAKEPLELAIEGAAITHRLVLGCPTKFIDDFLFSRFGAVRFETEALQPEFLQSAMDHVQRSHFCADEQDLSVIRERVRNQGCNSL